jgi:hypothetical protein
VRKLSFGVPTDEQLAKINRFTKKALSADEVFYWENKSCGDAMIPNRYMQLSKQLLELFVKDAQLGVSFMFNHSWADFGSKAIPYGKVMDGRLGPGTMAGESTALYLAKYIVRDAEKVDGVSADDLIKRIETGVLADTSIGWGTDVMVCSICGMNYWGGECSHWKGRTYQMADGTEKVCTVLAMPPSVINHQSNSALYEESIVWDGAYPTAALSMAKDGDVIDLQTGKFQVIEDKQELPKNTLIWGQYSNGSIVTMVKKSEPSKVVAVNASFQNKGDIAGQALRTVLKGVEKSMNEATLKMLESFGIAFKEGETKLEDVLAQMGEKWEATVQSIKDSVTPSPAPDAFMTKEQATEKLGKELPADEVLKLAKEGQEYHQQTINDAVAMGVKAMGNDFPADTWKNTFASMGTAQIKDIAKTWETQAKNSIPAGRLSSTGDEEKSEIPDDAFKVK